MAKTPPQAVALMFEHFGALKDRRVNRTRFHELLHILVMALCGAIAGAEGWDDLAEFARIREPLFREFLPLRRGTPSADTFRRVLSRLEPQALEACLRAWVGSVAQSFVGEVIAVDGKSVRGAAERAGSTSPLHLLHVWATEQQLLLAQRAVAGAPGEVSAIPELLRLLDLKGAVVSADANGCTPAVCEAVVAQGADYVLALKGNRAALHTEVQALFEAARPRAVRRRSAQQREAAHGRKEKRVVSALDCSALAAERFAQWKGLRTAVRVQRTREVAGRTSHEEHFYISSLAPDPVRLAHAVRAHWGVENNLHWCLDVAFGEDRRRVRDATGAQNLALLTRLALMLLKRESGVKRGVRAKQKVVGWQPDYLLTVLTRGLAI